MISVGISLQIHPIENHGTVSIRVFKYYGDDLKIEVASAEYAGSDARTLAARLVNAADKLDGILSGGPAVPAEEA